MAASSDGPTLAKLDQDYANRLDGARGARWRARLMARLVWSNNAMIRRVDRVRDNPRQVAGVGWYEDLRSAHRAMRAEWEHFEATGGTLPLVEDVFGGWQGNEDSWWRGTPVMVRRRPVGAMAADFPATVAALARIPGIHSVMWSVMGPGGRLPPHTGPNAGGLRLLIGVKTGGEAHLMVDGREFCVDDGEALLFDDTAVHASWNRGDEPRVFLLCDVIRPLPMPFRWWNWLLQNVHHEFIPRFRGAVRHGSDLYDTCNADRVSAA
jgi:hypothetical protein